MNARPTSVTVVSVILIVIGMLSLFSTFMIIVQRNDPLVQQAMAANPLPPQAQIAMGFVGALVMLISGIAMLRAQGWGRWLFTGYIALAFVVGIVTSPVKLLLIPSAILNLILIFFLFRPAASAYFGPSEAVSDA
ncbi:MAG TPA: hypothetical protein VHV55_26760 [Pirellulales bacterium]|jgi:hypothetical protein|nr:hypothetical protein [Pirellulales bacterium]